jgi:hypothetical protein
MCFPLNKTIRKIKIKDKNEIRIRKDRLTLPPNASNSHASNNSPSPVNRQRDAIYPSGLIASQEQDHARNFPCRSLRFLTSWVMQFPNWSVKSVPLHPKNEINLLKSGESILIEMLLVDG